jgi:hypothetical protein
MDSTVNPKGENNRRTRSWGTLLGSKHFQGRGACWSSRMGTRKSDKQVNYSHGPAQTKQQVGYCVVGTLLVHGQITSKHRLTRLITARTWGKPPPSPLFFMLGHRASTQMSFCPRIPKLGVPKFSKLGVPQLWRPITLCQDL